MTYLYLVALVYGLFMGNFLSTAYYRLPKNIPINGLSTKHGRKPHCSACGHELKMYEYFPLTSWIATRFKCNYCGAPITKEYFVLEIGMMIVGVISLKLHQTFDIRFVLTLPVYALYFLNVMLYIKHRKFFTKLVYFTIFTTALIYLLIW